MRGVRGGGGSILHRRSITSSSWQHSRRSHHIFFVEGEGVGVGVGEEGIKSNALAQRF